MTRRSSGVHSTPVQEQIQELEAVAKGERVERCTGFIFRKKPTMANQNCWEFKKCGRQPGGARAAQLGVCVAATMREADGFLGGRNAGRACAYVAGTLCGGEVQGEFAHKIRACFDCDFYRELQKGHGSDFNVMSFVKYTAARKKASGR